MQKLDRRQAMVLSASLLAIGLVTAGCGAQAGVKPPTDSREYATEQTSAQGAFVVSYKTDAGIPIGRLHSWTLHVSRKDGTPVTDAVIVVDGDMPEHRHGLPTRPRVTRHLGDGAYLLEGVKFQMGGWWVMDFDVTASGRSERVRFNLQLKK